MSRQKELIYNILQNSDGHLTASEIYSSARIILPNISLGTVYRDLAELYSESRIGRFISGDGTAVYDMTPGNHGHIRCCRCGVINDIPDPELIRHITDQVPGQVISANISVDYICRKCADEQ